MNPVSLSHNPTWYSFNDRFPVTGNIIKVIWSNGDITTFTWEYNYTIDFQSCDMDVFPQKWCYYIKD